MNRQHVASKTPTAFPPALMRVPEAASYLAISIRTVNTMIAAKTLPCVRMGKKCVRFRRTDLDRFIEERAG